MDNVKFNFLPLGQLESLNLNRILILTFIQNITMLRGFFGNLIFAIIAWMLCGNYLNSFFYFYLADKSSEKSYH